MFIFEQMNFNREQLDTKHYSINNEKLEKVRLNLAKQIENKFEWHYLKND